MWTVNPKHGTLATQYGTWFPGQPFVPPSNLPAKLFNSWRKEGVLIQDENGPDVEVFPTTQDVFASFNKETLYKLIQQNKLHELPDGMAVRPRTSWTEEQIREAIRYCNVLASDMTLDGQPLVAPAVPALN